MIPYGRQEVTREDIRAVVKVLRSDFLTQGPKVPEFERAVADYCGAEHAVAVNSGTSALHVACLALGLKPGDLVWTTPITFAASANCALYCGAKVDFVDIDPHTWNMSVSELERKLSHAVRHGRLPKIVIPVHLCGLPCEMQEIRRLARQYDFAVIEDACHALGGRYCDEPIGSCHYSDITVYSFHPVKIITTAEGGMALCNDPELAERMQLYRSHGITRTPEKMTHAPDGPWYYQQIDLGFNYRMTDIQAALGISQLKRLDAIVAQRNRLAARYDNRLKDLPLKLPYRTRDGCSAFHIYVVRLHNCDSGIRHLHLFEELRRAGIGVNLHYIPIHTHPFYQRRGFRNGDFPEAEKYYQEAVTLPLYPQLSYGEQDQVIDSLHDLLGC